MGRSFVAGTVCGLLKPSSRIDLLGRAGWLGLTIDVLSVALGVSTGGGRTLGDDLFATKGALCVCTSLFCRLGGNLGNVEGSYSGALIAYREPEDPVPILVPVRLDTLDMEDFDESADAVESVDVLRPAPYDGASIDISDGLRCGSGGAGPGFSLGGRAGGVFTG